MKQYYEEHTYLQLHCLQENNIDIPYGTFWEGGICNINAEAGIKNLYKAISAF
jgi:hypothetical protein